MILAAEYIPSPLKLMLVTWEIGFPIPPPVSRFFRETGTPPRFPIRRNRETGGKQGTPVSRFGRDRESGSRGRRAGDFLVCESHGDNPRLSLRAAVAPPPPPLAGGLKVAMSRLVPGPGNQTSGPATRIFKGQVRLQVTVVKPASPERTATGRALNTHNGVGFVEPSLCKS